MNPPCSSSSSSSSSSTQQHRHSILSEKSNPTTILYKINVEAPEANEDEPRLIVTRKTANDNDIDNVIIMKPSEDSAMTQSCGSSASSSSLSSSSSSSSSTSCGRKRRREVHFDMTPPRHFGEATILFSSPSSSSSSYHDDADGTNIKNLTVNHPLHLHLHRRAGGKELWYQPRDIMGFKAQTRQLVLFGKQADDDDLSGLERFNLERSNHKKRTIRCILLASKHHQQQRRPSVSLLERSNKDNPNANNTSSSTPLSDFVSKVSQQCTAVSTDLALVQGFNDFCQVYDPLATLLGSDDDDGGGDADADGGAATTSVRNYNDYFFSSSTRSGTPAPQQQHQPQRLQTGGGRRR